MSVIFYPHEDELETGSLDQRLEILLESAERYKAIVLDVSGKYAGGAVARDKKRVAPKDLAHAYNWEGIAQVLREIRELPESAPSLRVAKAMKLQKLAEVYEVLRGAKMSKLEAVRLALINEANQLHAREGA
ncbi:MAG: hypothetical protein SFW66_09510 [Gammaproteobacteria bacterium]|nr:hypothetical protein [Gammaproteobacteria bacterium]